MAGQLSALQPAPLPLGACGAYTTAVSAWPGGRGRAACDGGWGAGADARRWALHTRPSSLPKILQHQAALLAAAQGPGLGPVAAVAAQMQHVAAFSLVAAPLLPAAGTARRGRGPRRGRGEAGLRPDSSTSSPPAANSPQGGGPSTLPGLPAPIGVNGFGPLTPQTNGQPGSDSLYNNGLSPYPGGPPPPAPPKSPPKWSGERGSGGGRVAGPGLLEKGLLLLPCCLSQPPSTLPVFSPYPARPPAHLHCGPCAPLSPAQSPGVADPLQQAYAGMHHYAGFTWRYAAWGV